MIRTTFQEILPRSLSTRFLGLFQLSNIMPKRSFRNSTTSKNNNKRFGAKLFLKVSTTGFIILKHQRLILSRVSITDIINSLSQAFWHYNSRSTAGKLSSMV